MKIIALMCIVLCIGCSQPIKGIDNKTTESISFGGNVINAEWNEFEKDGLKHQIDNE